MHLLSIRSSRILVCPYCCLIVNLSSSVSWSGAMGCKKLSNLLSDISSMSFQPCKKLSGAKSVLKGSLCQIEEVVLLVVHLLEGYLIVVFPVLFHLSVTSCWFMYCYGPHSLSWSWCMGGLMNVKMEGGKYAKILVSSSLRVEVIIDSQLPHGLLEMEV